MRPSVFVPSAFYCSQERSEEPIKPKKPKKDQSQKPKKDRSQKLTDQNNENQVQELPKRGRGRPRKDSTPIAPVKDDEPKKPKQSRKPREPKQSKESQANTEQESKQKDLTEEEGLQELGPTGEPVESSGSNDGPSMELNSVFLNLFFKENQPDGLLRSADSAMIQRLKASLPLQKISLICLFSVADDAIYTDLLATLGPNYKTTRRVVLDKEIFALIYDSNLLAFEDEPLVYSNTGGSMTEKGYKIVAWTMTHPSKVKVIGCHYYNMLEDDRGELLSQSIVNTLQDQFKLPLVPYFVHDPVPDNHPSGNQNDVTEYHFRNNEPSEEAPQAPSQISSSQEAPDDTSKQK